MVERRVASFFDKRGLRPRGTAIGVALSGGADSVALLAAMRALGWECVALHCNFHLRGAESDRDARHAAAIAGKLGCEFVSVDFDVEARRKETGESVEMACRGLRYEWFERVAAERKLGFVAIAHHAADQEETFLLNALRGTGLKGLSGMPPARGIFLRPMLGCSRGEIEDYLAKRGLDYVTDSSNLVADVKRNRLRLNILPQLHRDFPDASVGLARTMENLRSDYGLLAALIDRESAKLIDDEAIDVLSVVEGFGSGLAGNMLYRLMKKVAGCDGDAETANRVIASVAESGRYFYFGHRRFLLDRGRLVLLGGAVDDAESASCGCERLVLDFDGLMPGEKRQFRFGGRVLEAELLPADALGDRAGRGEIWLDSGVLDEALTLRHPRIADRMTPFGMRGTVLLSKLMKGAKIPDNEKSRQLVLLAGDRILWLCGIRCSRHFPVTAASESVLRIRLI